ncbi:MAG TPA: aquaporin [Solirubrobacteraceae bacterium]
MVKLHRKLVAEALGTAVLVIVGVGVATLSFGFKFTGTSTSAGVVATALAFGFVLLALAYTLGPISGANVNPAVTLGFVLSGRMSLKEASGYWAAQFVGGILGALILWGIFSSSPEYSRSVVGLGTNGWGPKVSMTGIGLGGAFAVEVVLTYIFVTAVLVATSRVGSPGFAGLAIGVGLTVVHLIGIPLTGTSVNPARSLGPALIVGHKALSQVWLFIVAPLVGGGLAALSYRYFVPKEPVSIPSAIAEGDVERTTGAPEV